LTSPTQWLYSSFLSGTNFATEGTGIALQPNTSKVFVTGLTASTNFPTTAGVVQPKPGWPSMPPTAGQYTNAFITAMNF
jgi:hypothetical protein